MKRLIISEKNIAARRIAQLLATGQVETEKAGSVQLYKFRDDGTETTCLGLKGHILKVDFPPEYANWQAVEPSSLVDAKLIKVPTEKTLVSLLRKQAKEADEVVIATDFDREGELIGQDAVGQILDVRPDAKIKRARFSALTEGEIGRAFSHLEEMYVNLAQAGEARQDIDLIWGATLTRFLSLASTRLGSHFLSVGRVQSPTLYLTVQRERERQAFTPEPYWQLKGRFRAGDTDFEAGHKTERFLDKTEVDAALARLGDEGTVTSVKKTSRKSEPPAPFNTTAFLAAAASLGISPSHAMRVAESLYMSGLISYPRVDNTVYPESLQLREILSSLEAPEGLGALAAAINRQPKLTPTRGKKQATDHPPIHPTAAAPGQLTGADWRIYELVVRRFLATLAPAATLESGRIDIDVSGEPFFLRGSRTVDEGWLEYYPYGKKKDDILPELHEGEAVKLLESLVEEKETQPPARYSQGTLIQKMEELGLGTKATRHAIIQNLYDRGYVHSDPVVPTDLGMAVSEALRRHADKICSEDMTAELEREMDGIAEGRATKDQVVERSRQMLAQTMLTLVENREAVGQVIREGIIDGKTVGKCPQCGSDLRVIRAKKTRKRFVGCSGYPDCKVAYPLPQFGEVIPLGKTCDQCGSPMIKVVSKGRRPWELCLDPNCPTKQEYKRNKKD